jgi:hypothetical protein
VLLLPVVLAKRALVHVAVLNWPSVSLMRASIPVAVLLTKHIDGQGVWAVTGNANPGSQARLYAALPALIAFLQHERRVSCRALAHVLNGDQEFLDGARGGAHPQSARSRRSGTGPGLDGRAHARPPAARGPHKRGVRPAARGCRSAPNTAAPAPEDIGRAERRQLTVMFCDLADSTVLAGRLDAEDLREVIGSYQASAAEVVQRFWSHIAQYLGDGLLVYLGWPEAGPRCVFDLPEGGVLRMGVPSTEPCLVGSSGNRVDREGRPLCSDRGGSEPCATWNCTGRCWG